MSSHSRSQIFEERGRGMAESAYNSEASEQIGAKLEKLKAYAEALRGKELQLQEKERELKQKELGRY